MKKIHILFDCRLDDNDKTWLLDGLESFGYEVKAYGMPIRLTELIRNGILGRIKNYYYQIQQVIRALCNSDKDDIIIVWYSVTGQIMNMVSRAFGGRSLVLMNFLTPTKRHGFKHWLVKETVKNPRNVILVNSFKSEMQYYEMYNIRNRQGASFHYFPDVFDNSQHFKAPKEKPIETRYFFTGGMSNRDWVLLKRIADSVPRFKFVCCALQKDFEEQVKTLPGNMEVYYNLSPDEYYRIMRDSYCVLLPLRDSSVAGLINILKSIQEGVPCYVSKTPGTEQYYDVHNQYFLLPNNIDSWIKAVDYISGVSFDEYCSAIKDLQSYVNSNFSPSSALKRLQMILS